MLRMEDDLTDEETSVNDDGHLARNKLRDVANKVKTTLKIKNKRLDKFINNMTGEKHMNVFEVDYLKGDYYKLKNDVYDLTIAANMEKNSCSARELDFCIK